MDRSASVNIRTQNPQEPKENPEPQHNQEPSLTQRTAVKKSSCCSDKHRPFFKVEREQPTMTLRTKAPTKTLYQKDYIKHPIEGTRNMKNDLWTTFHNEETMDFTTTMRNDYQPKKVTKPVTSMAARPVTTHVPFGGKASYRREFVDWKGNQAMMTMPVQPSTVISNLPFLDRTTYRADYAKPAKDDDLNEQLRNVNKQKKDSSLFPVMPLLGETTYGRTFKGFKVAGVPLGTKAQEPYGNTAYPGQYQTLSKEEYSDPKKRWHCIYKDEEESEEGKK